jgi:hypothetical protein
LDLDLDCCTNGYVCSDEEDDYYKQLYQNGIAGTYARVREALINSAVDEKLVLSIWDILSEKRQGQSLQSLVIKGVGGYFFGRCQLDDVTKRVLSMSRSFQLTRSERQDSKEVEVVELNKSVREERDEQARKTEAEWVKKWNRDCVPEMTELFEKIWPPKAGSQGWRDDWSSIPLQRSLSP